MINAKALERLTQVNISGVEIVKMFEMLANVLENQPAEQVAWTLGYVGDNELQVGELVPVINLVLTKHNPKELQSNVNDTL
jgi:hypothetical protein